MTAKFNEILSEKLNLDDESREVIREEWESKLSEAREEIASELREEFAQKFTHDKDLIVKSMDTFLNDKIAGEMQELAEDKKALIAERVKYRSKVKEHSTMLNTFVKKQLVKELTEHKSERTGLKKNMVVLENFVLKQLANEIKEFHADKKALQEQRVKLVREGKTQLVEAKKTFVKRAANVIEENVSKALEHEISQFKADINQARENEFGRKVFEAFVGEFMTSYLNEGSEVKKLQAVIVEQEDKIEKSKVRIAKQKALTESINTKLSASKDRLQRDRIMARLISPLGKEKQGVMKELLESVMTKDLEKSFNKYLPAVLNESTAPRRQNREKKNLNESVTSEKTGNRTRLDVSTTTDSNVTEIENLKRLAGI